MRPVRLLLLAGGLAAVLGAAAWWLGRPEPTGPVRASLSLSEALGPADGGFAPPAAPPALSFPVDHGPHPEYRTEWWSYTGNLDAVEGGRAFGFQLTVFRVALVPQAVVRASAWGARDVYFSHFALTDVAAARFHARERWSRGAVGLAGATAVPVRVWVTDWAVAGETPTGVPMRVHAATEEVGIDLALASARPPLLPVEWGLWRGAVESGAASLHYSMTRMPARGTVRVGTATLPVRGLAWMDHEWSTRALGAGRVGWDRFALQLADGRELMVYRLRGTDGSSDGASVGSLVERDGAVRTLGPGDVHVDVLGRWTSPRGGTRYPASWRLRVPAVGLDLVVDALVADQELDVAIRYWEGAVRVRGTTDGRGYVELTGYVDAARGESGRR